MNDLEFDPYQTLMDVQNLQHQQATNMVNVSDWMIVLGQQVDSHRRQLDAMTSIIKRLDTVIKIQDSRIKLLEHAKDNGINNQE